MRELASVEMHGLAEELQKLKGMYVKKFYDLGDGAFKILISGKEGQQILYCKLLRTINTTSFTEQAGEATNFAIAMRKRVEGTKIGDIGQHGCDRIMIIDLVGKENYKLIIEMYGKGNLLLVGKDGTIDLAYRIMEQKSRTIRPKEKYELGKPRTFGAENIEDAIHQAHNIEKKLIVTLSSSLETGPLYVEEILARAKLEPGLKFLNEKQFKDLKASIEEFYSRIGAEKPRIYVDKDGAYVDYAIIGIEKYKGYEAAEFDSLCELLDKFYLAGRAERSEVDRKAEEIKSSIEQQKKSLERLEIDGKESAKKGNIILNRMSEINLVINYLRENRRATLKELENAFPHLRFKNLDLKEKTVTIEMD